MGMILWSELDTRTHAHTHTRTNLLRTNSRMVQRSLPVRMHLADKLCTPDSFFLIEQDIHICCASVMVQRQGGGGGGRGLDFFSGSFRKTRSERTPSPSKKT